MPGRREPGRDVRVDPRVPVRLPGTLFTPATGPEGAGLTMLNLSGSGALCETSAHCALGWTVRLCIELTDASGCAHRIAVEALPVRVEGTGPFLIALHFMNLPERIRELIRRFVFEKLRERSEGGR